MAETKPRPPAPLEDPFESPPSPSEAVQTPQSPTDAKDGAATGNPGTAEALPLAWPPARPPVSGVLLSRGAARTQGGLMCVSGIITPVVAKAEEAIKAWQLFTELKEKLLTKEDYFLVGTKLHPGRTGWRKLALFFGLSSPEIVEERRWERNGEFGYDFVVRVVAANSARRNSRRHECTSNTQPSRTDPSSTCSRGVTPSGRSSSLTASRITTSWTSSHTSIATSRIRIYEAPF